MKKNNSDSNSVFAIHQKPAYPPPPFYLILASASPRRKELLKTMGIPFFSQTGPFVELNSGDKPVVQTERNAHGKVKTLLETHCELNRHTILGADTCIDLDGTMIGKPKNREEAFIYLKAFSNREHKVITSLCIYTTTSYILSTETTYVSFSKLTNREIEMYLDSDEWQDAAGGYRIQGRGAVYINQIKGCYFNVMGLPIRRFYGMLAKENPELLEKWGF